MGRNYLADTKVTPPFEIRPATLHRIGGRRFDVGEGRMNDFEICDRGALARQPG